MEIINYSNKFTSFNFSNAGALEALSVSIGHVEVLVDLNNIEIQLVGQWGGLLSYTYEGNTIVVDSMDDVISITIDHGEVRVIEIIIDRVMLSIDNLTFTYPVTLDDIRDWGTYEN